METLDFHQNFHLFYDELSQSECQHEASTLYMQLQKQTGEGGIHRFIPRYDMEVVVTDFKFHREHRVPLFNPFAMVELNFCLHGSREVAADGKTYEFTAGMSTLQFMNEMSAHFTYSEKEPFLMLRIGIPVSTFDHFMQQADGASSTDFSSLLGSRALRIFQETVSPSTELLLKRVIDTASRGTSKNIEIESDVLQLLATAFQSFLVDKNYHSTVLSTSDMRKIQQARDIIMERMVDPPSLIELSRMIGMNDYKLKIGFKEMYHTTVFGYLREKRLEKALLLLQQGEMNVTETSFAVGYSNSSYFAEAFREKYGINPSAFARRSHI